jgi:hypothetical protein
MIANLHDAVPVTPLALVIVALTALLAPDIDQYRSTIAPAAPVTCNACGTVEMVRELERRVEDPAGGRASESVLGYRMGGGGGEGFVILLAAMGGVRQAERLYEIDVRFEDGALRSFRYGQVPPWKLGDRVRVIQGRIVRQA